MITKFSNHKKLLTLIVLCSLYSMAFGQNAISIPKEISLLAGEKFWNGSIIDGHLMPLSKGTKFDFYGNNRWNQLQPLLLSNKGLYVWSEEPFAFEIKESKLVIKAGSNEVRYGRSGHSLSEAYRFASRNFFKPDGKIPDTLLFTRPQYNTWIELNYNQNQEDILNYARSIIKNGFPAGVIMIDDSWQEDYGLWKFHPGRFPNPKLMINELHQMGFKVMLWICPFISADQVKLYKTLKDQKALLFERTSSQTKWGSATDPAMIRWWNGVSAELDFTNPLAVDWFDKQLKDLTNTYGVDGFKFDAGDMPFYPSNTISKEDVTPNRHCELYAQFGLKYPLNEYRACWKMAGKPLVQRLFDKNHTWEDMQKLIPHMITEGLSGYTFSCPDMIGGGMLESFENSKFINQELVVRSAQCHALMPMMQFSVAPWRILDKTHLDAMKKVVDLRQKYMKVIMDFAKKGAETGIPIVTNMEFYFPNQGFDSIIDQFFLGEKILVAPMVKSGTSRNVVLPKGRWRADDGKLYKGGKTYTLDVPLDRLPYFELLANN